MISDFLSRIVKNILLSAKRQRSALYLDSPVWVSLIKFRVRGYHFRLEPNAELHAKLIYLVNKIFKTALELLLINEPIAQ